MKFPIKIIDGLLASDTESTGLNPWGDMKRWGFWPARPFAFSFCNSEGETAYIRWEVDPKTRRVIPNLKELALLKELYADPRIIHIGHNFGFDIRMLQFTGIEVKGRIEDTIVMAHIATGGSELTYALKPLADRYLGIPQEDEKDLQQATIRARNRGKKEGAILADKGLFGKSPIKADYWMAPPDLCKKYAVTDAVRTMMFYLLMKPEIDASPELSSIYEREMKIFHIVRKMENRGCRLHPDQLLKLRKFYTEYMEKQLKLSEQHGGKGLNFRSHKQMTHKFYVEKKCEPKYSDKGNYKLDGEKLAALAQTDPLARAVLEYKGGGHMLSAFLDPYDRFKVQDEVGDWVIHPGYKQTGTVTGRFSGADPNLMQVASETTGRRKTEITLRPREAFGPRDGYVWYLPDYSQIEVWVFSFLAREEAMMKALLAGEDFHSWIANLVWSHEPDFAERKSYYRKRAKLVMFCNLYGGGTKKVAFLMECPVDEAGKFVGQYDEKLPGVRRFMKRMINQATREGGISNAFGRRYYLPPNFAYRAVNYLVQGSCADIMKQAMINVDELFASKWKGCHLLLTLHDELVIEVPLKLHSKRLMRDIITAMQGNFHEIIGIPKPLPVSMKIATKYWSETKDIE